MIVSVITLFEHETVDFAWTDRDLAALARVNRSVGVEVLSATIGRGGQRRLQAAQHVGVVRLGARTFQILPKMYRPDAGGGRAQEATHNLLSLLAYAGCLTIREHALAPLLRQDADWFELLTRLFPSHLRDEWRRGVLRGYQARDEDSPTLRGRWRVGDQLRRPERRHLFAVTYDEFTADNPLNRVFRFVVERLWRLTRHADNRQTLGLLREWMEDVALLPSVTAADASPALLTRQHQSYAPLLTLARLFLEGGALQLESGSHETFAFLFDMNQLFEAFVVNFIRRHRTEILPASLQNCDLLPQSQGAVFHLAQTNGTAVFRLKPDLALRAPDGTFPLLLDAKYKTLNPNNKRLGISESDFYQMYAYARRYDCPRVLLVYPQTAEMPTPIKRAFLLEDGKTVQAMSIDVRKDFARPVVVQETIAQLTGIAEGMNNAGNKPL